MIVSCILRFDMVSCVLYFPCNQMNSTLDSLSAGLWCRNEHNLDNFIDGVLYGIQIESLCDDFMYFC